MRAVVVGLALIAVVSGFQDAQKGYHATVGIPEAAKIKAAEEQILAKADVNIPESDRIVGGANAPNNAHPYLVRSELRNRFGLEYRLLKCYANT